MSSLGLLDRVAPYPEFSVDEVERLLVGLMDREQEERREIANRMERARERVTMTLDALGRRFQPRAEPRAETRGVIG
jgi:hypothetical protein